MLRPAFARRPVEGDEQTRLVCDHCGFIDYQNPRIVVGSVATWEGSYLLCKRAIEPRRGFWTLPAGFLEQGEEPQAGAAREAREEACVDLDIEGLLAVYSILHISQVQLFYRARLLAPSQSPGIESLEVNLFSWDDIPWDRLAFPSVEWALRDHHSIDGAPLGAPFSRSTSTSAL